jgi:hypothetical protein
MLLCSPNHLYQHTFKNAQAESEVAALVSGFLRVVRGIFR